MRKGRREEIVQGWVSVSCKVVMHRMPNTSCRSSYGKSFAPSQAFRWTDDVGGAHGAAPGFVASAATAFRATRARPQQAPWTAMWSFGISRAACAARRQLRLPPPPAARAPLRSVACLVGSGFRSTPGLLLLSVCSADELSRETF